MANTAFIKFDINPNGGDVTIELRAREALPIEGILTVRGGSADYRSDPRTDDLSIITWTLPPNAVHFVLTGIIIPPQNLSQAPAYSRLVTQGGQPAKTRSKNPIVRTTKKFGPGEWFGSPEAIVLDPV